MLLYIQDEIEEVENEKYKNKKNVEGLKYRFTLR